MNTETFTREQLVSFGNYLLSDERKALVSEQASNMVNHADVENWIEKEDKE